MDHCIHNNLSFENVDQYAFVDLKTRDTYLFSRKDMADGKFPRLILDAIMLPSAACLGHNYMVRRAVDNDLCAYVRRNARIGMFNPTNCPDWELIKTPPMHLTHEQQVYAVDKKIDSAEMHWYLGLPRSNSQLRPSQEKNRKLFLPHAMANIFGDNCKNMGSADTNSIAHLCRNSFANWNYKSRDESCNSEMLLHNLKARPFQPLNQDAYLIYMMQGLPHNIAVVLDELAQNCIKDANMRLMFRVVINDSIYNQRIDGVIGRDGECK